MADLHPRPRRGIVTSEVGKRNFIAAASYLEEFEVTNQSESRTFSRTYSKELAAAFAILVDHGEWEERVIGRRTGIAIYRFGEWIAWEDEGHWHLRDYETPERAGSRLLEIDQLIWEVKTSPASEERKRIIAKAREIRDLTGLQEDSPKFVRVEDVELGAALLVLVEDGRENEKAVGPRTGITFNRIGRWLAWSSEERWHLHRLSDPVQAHETLRAMTMDEWAETRMHKDDYLTRRLLSRPWPDQPSYLLGLVRPPGKRPRSLGDVEAY